MTTENLTIILNKLLAMQTARIVTVRDIAKAVGVREQRAQEWITRRIRRPNGDAAIKLLAFAANMTLKITKRPAMREKYIEAYEAACMKFPTDGREK